MTLRPTILALPLALALLAPACAKMKEAVESRGPSSATAPATVLATAEERASETDDRRSEAAGGKNSKQSPGPAQTPRKIIRNGELRVVVKVYEPARQAIELLVRREGGYLSSTQVHHSLGEVSSATLTLRVPAGSFAHVARRIAALGILTYESTGSQDITEQYYDLKARLSNARKLEARLLELLARATGKVSELLQVEKEIARVREEIERFEGKLRLFDNLVELSTLTVQLSIQERYVPPRPPGLGEDARRILGDSWDALRGLGRGLLLLAVALLPWAIPLGALVWIALRLFRRWRARRRARRAAEAAARGR